MTIRLSGMSSGLDTDALVRELSKAYSKKTDKYKGEQQKLQWKTEIWSDLNKKVKSFYSKISNFRFSSAYNLKKTTVSDATKATVTASNSAVNGTQSLNITSLAKTGYLTGAKVGTTTGVDAGGGTTLRELGMSQDSGKVNLNGKELTFNATDTVSQVVEKLKNAGVNASFDEKNQRIFVSSKNSGAANDFTLTGNDAGGADALHSLGLLVGSDTEKKLSAQFQALKKADGESDSDYKTRLAGVLDKYNAAAKVSSSTADTAASNIEKAKNYLTAATDRKNLVEKFGGEDYWDEHGNALADNASDMALLADPSGKAFIDGELYNTASDEEGNITYTKADGSGTTLSESDITDGGMEKKTVDEYLIEKYSHETTETDGEGNPQTVTKGLTSDDISSFRTALGTINSFNDAVTAEQSAGTTLSDYTYTDTNGASQTVAYSTMTLEALRSAVDAGLDAGTIDEADLNSMASEAAIGKNAASAYLSNNSYIASYATNYAAAADDDGRELALNDLIDRIDYASTQQNYNDGATRVNASDATIYLNGAMFTGSSNTFNINGLTINATAVTMTEEQYAAADDKARDSAAISINTATDSQGLYDSIKDLFSEYNSVINELTTYYNAASAKGYDVLTDDEKDEMSDTEVEKWNDKIKSSLLRNDTTLGGLISSMTGILAGQYSVNGKNYSLASFGIQTLGYSAAEKNEYNAYHIYGDEDDDEVSTKADKLLAMINEDPEAVAGTFQQIFGKMYSTLTDKMKATSLSSSMTLYNDKEMAKEYSTWNTTISNWEQKVQDIEDSYYSKFAAMEKALSKLESSTNQLSSLFGG